MDDRRAKESPKAHEFRYLIRASVVFLVSRIIISQLVIVAISLAITMPLILFKEEIDNVIHVLALYPLVMILIQGIDATIIVVIILDWVNTIYIIRPKEIIIQKGIWKIREHVYATDHIEEVTVDQSMWGRIFNYGKVKVYNPALHEDVYLDNIPNPNVYARVIRQSEKKEEVKFYPKREFM